MLGLEKTTAKEVQIVIHKQHTANVFGNEFPPCCAQAEVVLEFDKGKSPGQLSVWEMAMNSSIPNERKLWAITKMMPWKISARIALKEILKKSWYLGIDGEIQEQMSVEVSGETNEKFVKSLNLRSLSQQHILLRVLNMWKSGDIREIWGILYLIRGLVKNYNKEDERQMKELKWLLKRGMKTGFPQK